MSQLLTERHAAKIRGTISCLDRVVIIGTLPTYCYADGLTGHLYKNNIRIFDYARWAEPLREQMRAHAERVAAQAAVRLRGALPRRAGRPRRPRRQPRDLLLPAGHQLQRRCSLQTQHRQHRRAVLVRAVRHRHHRGGGWRQPGESDQRGAALPRAASRSGDGAVLLQEQVL